MNSLAWPRGNHEVVTEVFRKCISLELPVTEWTTNPRRPVVKLALLPHNSPTDVPARLRVFSVVNGKSY
jgi:hypothetical protein